MARTTQTARRSTGGKAPHASDQLLEIREGDQPANERAVGEPAKSLDSDARQHNQVSTLLFPINSQAYVFFQTWCYLCLNGGTLYLCDLCPQVVCSNHIPLPEGSDIRKAVFICISCHIAAFEKATPYSVCFPFLLVVFFFFSFSLGGFVDIVQMPFRDFTLVQHLSC